MSAFTKLRRTLGQVLEVVLESPCSLCDRSTSEVCCVDCWRQIRRCQLSFAQSVEHIAIETNETDRQATPPLLAWGAYQGSLKRAIAHLKYGHRESLGCKLGQELGRAWVNAKLLPSHSSAHSFVAIPIPLHADKQIQRGYNQAELIATGFCEITGVRLHPSMLERVRSTEAQFGLSAAQREQNLTAAFRVNRTDRRPSTHVKAILIDDIYTTGATIRAAAAALAQQHIQVVGIAAIARPQHYQHS